MDPRAKANDLDPVETREWIDALAAVLAIDGEERAHFLIEELIDHARRTGMQIPYRPHTTYVNTIPVSSEHISPGDASLEWRIRSLIRWKTD